MQGTLKVVAAVFMLFFGAGSNANTLNIDMFSGEVKVLGTFDLSRVAIGDGKVVRVETKDGGELILIAQAAGSSSLRLWLKSGAELDYNIRVSKGDPETRLRMESMVRMNVKMIEVRKNAISDLGIDWSNQVNGPAISTVGDFMSSSLFRSSSASSGISETLPLSVEPFSTHFGLATSITSKINFLASSGDATTIAEPTLSCTNNGTATFLAGGEIPYPVTGSNGQTTVEFKEYGIKLEISPQVDTDGNIYTSILTEISQIDPSVSVLGAPGILTRRAQTHINVVTGQTMVISGLLSTENSIDENKLPWLGDLPFVGGLFGSTNTRNQMTELVIFVTPEVIKPQSLRFTKREREAYEFGTERMQKVREKLVFKLMD
jgi:pilus assembly protein CpaC